MSFNLRQMLFSGTGLGAIALTTIGISGAPAEAAYCTTGHFIDPGASPFGCYEIINGRFAGTSVTFSGGFILTTGTTIAISSGSSQLSTLPGFQIGGTSVTTTSLTDFNVQSLTFTLPPVLATYAAPPAPTGIGSVIGIAAPGVVSLGTYGDLATLPLGVQQLEDGTYIRATLSLYTSQTINNSFTGQGGIYGGSLSAEIYDFYSEQSRSFPYPPIQTFSIPVLGADITQVSPIPTPALLPGLVGFSVSLWRKRKLQAI